MVTAVLASGWAALAPLLLVVASRCLPDRETGPERSTALVGAALLGLGLVGLGALASGVTLPAPPSSWVVLLQDGPGRMSIHAVTGTIDYAGAGYHTLLDLLGARDLTGVVRVNLLLGLVNAGLFLAIAGSVLRSWVGATLATAVLLAFPWPFLTVRSEIASGAVTTGFLAGVIAVAAFDRAEERPGRQWEAMALLILASALAAACRAETVLVSGCAVLWLGARMSRGDKVIARMERRFLAILSHPSRWPRRRRWQAVLVLVLGLVFWKTLASGSWLSWVCAGLYPLNPTFLTLPLVLVGLLPAGVAALGTLGLVTSATRIGRLALLPVSVLLLFRTWVAASTGDAEPMLRYGTMLAPVALLFAVFGWAWLEQRAEARRWGRGWRVFALVVILGVSLPVPGGPDTAARATTSNPTREARFLLDSQAALPQCVHVTRVPTAWRWRDHDGTYTWLAFGGGLEHLREAPAADMSVRNFALRLAPDARCVAFYAGLDCNLRGEDRCGTQAVGLPALVEERFRDEPWADEDHGEHEPNIVLGLYRTGGAGQ